VGVLTIEEYIERRRKMVIMKYAQMRNIYTMGSKCKTSQKIASNPLFGGKLNIIAMMLQGL
jgi:hypothetical protein